MRSTDSKERRGIASWSIRRPIGTVVLTMVALVLGTVFIGDIPLDLLPRIVYPQIRVNVSNPGVEPSVMEETVAKPLESALSTTENITRLETDIGEGRAGVTLHFPYGINPDIALQNASTNLNRARSQLPEEASPPTIGKSDPSQSPVYEVAFSSDERDLVSLRTWVDERLRPQLLTVEGVASVDVSGGLVREVQVTLDQERLQSYGITVSEVINALRSANQDVAAGRIGSTEHEVVGKTEGKFRSIAEIRGLLLNVGGGRSVPLTEVATVEDTHQKQRLWARLHQCQPDGCPALGVPAVRMSIRKQPDGNTVAIAENIEAKLESLTASNFIPGDIGFAKIRDQAAFIRNSLNSVKEAALLGALLSMVVVLVFLGSLRKTIVIGLAIPIAILATFVLMGMANLTLNIMSLGGLALGVGMLVDNSIVMLENIFRKRDEEGIEDPEEAAHEGAAEVSSAVTAATTTHIAAVVPFLLITGLTSLIFRELILTISFSIAASLAVALTLVPMLSAQLSKIRFTSGLGSSRPLVAFDRGMDRLRAKYRDTARATLSRRWLVVGGSIACLALTVFLTRNLGNEFLPQVDDGSVGVTMTLRPGSTPEMTNSLTLELERMVGDSMPYIESFFATAGGAAFGGATANSSGRGNIDIRLVPLSDRDMGADEWVRRLQDRINARGFPGARVFVRPPRIQGLRTNTAGSDISVAIQGDDLAELQHLAREVANAARGIPGLQNMEASTEEASPILSVRLDRERASYLGLNVASVGQTLRTALDGTVATRYAEGNREFDVRVMLPREKFTSPEDLGAVALFPAGSGRAPIYLRDVADVGTKLAPTGIRRENQSRLIRMNGDVVTETATIGEVTDSLRRRLAGMELPDGYGIILGGEDEAIRENNRQVAMVAFLAVFLVFVVMAIQYESVINPLVILVAVPLSLVGVGLALWITNTPLSAPVLLGVILLAGIVVNNSILLVEYAEQYREQKGVSLEEAALHAGATRLRPILMTTLTTLFGMLPLALGIGEGTEMMQPLAIAVIGGLTVSTVLTLLVVPSTYVSAHVAGDRLKSWMTGRRSSDATLVPEGQPAGD